MLALPLFHIHGLGVGLHGTLLAGASAVLLPRFDPDAVLDAVAAHDATLFFGVPTMYARLAGSPRLAELGRLRLCVSGSAPLPPAVFDRLADGSGQRILERYGMTETGMNVSNPYDGERRPGTVGFPLPGVELRLADDGEVQLRGPNVFGGYWGRPEATAAAFTDDGWFRTGDIGEHDPDGYLRLVGRARELIITGGLNVYPREVEDVLLEHPGVAEVAVAGDARRRVGRDRHRLGRPAGVGSLRRRGRAGGVRRRAPGPLQMPPPVRLRRRPPPQRPGQGAPPRTRPRIDRRTGRPVPSRTQLREVRWKAGAVPQL